MSCHYCLRKITLVYINLFLWKTTQLQVEYNGNVGVFIENIDSYQELAIWHNFWVTPVYQINKVNRLGPNKNNFKEKNNYFKTLSHKFLGFVSCVFNKNSVENTCQTAKSKKSGMSSSTKIKVDRSINKWNVYPKITLVVTGYVLERSHFLFLIRNVMLGI